MKEEAKRTIGRTDKVDFPEWELYGVDAKIDSGAYTSSIHCENIGAFYVRDQHYVRFTLQEEKKSTIKECKVFASKQVKNSFGAIEYRYSVKTEIRLFEKDYTIELALTDRSSMKYPVLLGRKLLRNRFIIDVTKRNLSYKEKLSSQIKASKLLKKQRQADQ